MGKAISSLCDFREHSGTAGISSKRLGPRTSTIGKPDIQVTSEQRLPEAQEPDLLGSAVKNVHFELPDCSSKEKEPSVLEPQCRELVTRHPKKPIPKSKSNGAISEGVKAKNSTHFSENDFVFHNVLGVGAFGRVYRAHKKSNPSEVYAIKVISKNTFKNKKADHIHTELKILSIVSTGIVSPFLTQMYCSFQSDQNLYFCLEYVPGGTLRKYLDHMKQFSLAVATHVAAEVLLGLYYLHEKLDIIHRDLKLENILIDEAGHCKLSDFGLSKVGKIEAYSFCGTYNYIAPELIKLQGYDKMVDFWTLGNLIYEMLTGKAPFDHRNRKTLFDMINAGCYKQQLVQDADARDLISRLLVVNPQVRLGCDGIDKIMSHRFFKNTDFKKIAKREIPSPLKSFVTLTPCEDVVNSPNAGELISPQMTFERFSWVKPQFIGTVNDEEDEGLYY